MFFQFVLPGLILVSAMVDDLRSKKIHNVLIIISFVVAIVSIVILQGFSALFPAFGKLLVALGISAPLFFLKVLGGGDVKLYSVLALVLSPRILILSLILGFVWGAVLGVVKIILDKKAHLMLVNLLSLLKFKKLPSDTLHKFPFSIGLFLGWLSSFYF